MQWGRGEEGRGREGRGGDRIGEKRRGGLVLLSGRALSDKHAWLLQS